MNPITRLLRKHWVSREDYDQDISKLNAMHDRELYKARIARGDRIKELENINRHLMEKLDWVRTRQVIGPENTYTIRVTIRPDIAHAILAGQEGFADYMAKDVAYRVQQALRDLSRWERVPGDDWRLR